MYKTSDAQCNCSPPNEQYSVHPQAAIAAPQVNSPSSYTGHDVIRYVIHLWPVGVSCPSCVPSQLPMQLADQGSVRS